MGERYEHRGRRPTVDPSAWVAPTAVLCGDVRVGPDCRILWGAVLTAEDGHVELGARCIVMEQALLRGRAAHPVTVGDDVMVGPHAHLNGARIGAEAFVATGASIFPGAVVGARSEVRIGAVVHVNSRVEEDGLVPIGWVAVGDPARVLPPERHEEIWAMQQGLDFPGTVYGLPPGTPRRERMERPAEWFGAHRDDVPLG